MSIGDALAAARRQAGLTVTQVSQRTCIRETIVRGIERDDFSACGGDFYARGHIRSIARVVGLDPDELVREYDATQAPPRPISAADVFQPFTPVKLRERRRPNWTIALIACLVAALGIVGFRYFGRSHHTTPPRGSQDASQHHAPPKVTATPKPTATIPPYVRITLVAKTGNVSWAELTAASGRIIFEGDVGGGYPTTMTRTESDPIRMDLGNPGGVLVYLNGKPQSMEQTNPILLTCTRVRCTPG